MKTTLNKHNVSALSSLLLLSGCYVGSVDEDTETDGGDAGETTWGADSPSGASGEPAGSGDAGTTWGDDSSSGAGSEPAGGGDPGLDTVLVDVRGDVMEVHYTAIGELAVTELDIVLADLGELADGHRSLITLGETWPGGVIPFVIDAGIQPAMASTIEHAIQHWQHSTSITLVPRSNEPDYVTFVPHADSCLSSVGRVGGPQHIWLAPACNDLAVVAHEIGHTVGLLHEQGRADSDAYVDIRADNVKPQYLPQFEQQMNAKDSGTYDYESVMHYPWYAFAIDPSLPTITKKDGFPIAQNTLGLSCGDLAGVEALYGTTPSHPRRELVVHSADGAWIGVLHMAESGLVACGIQLAWINVRGHGYNDGWGLRQGDHTNAADIDGDGRQELVRRSPDGKWIGLIRSHGYRLAADWIGFDWVNHPGQVGANGWNLRGGDRIVAADLDGDQREELAIVSADGDWIGLLHESAGGLTAGWIAFDWINHPGQLGANGWNLRAGDHFLATDLDGDARDELVAIAPEGEWIGLLRGESGGLVAGWIGYDWVNHPGQIGSEGWNLRAGDSYYPADLDGDGRHELVVLAPDGEWIGLLHGESGALTAGWIGFDWVPPPGGAANTGWNLQSGDRLMVADLEGDGRDELLVTSPDGEWFGIMKVQAGALTTAWIGFDWINHPGQVGAEGWNLRPGDTFIVADVDGNGADELLVLSLDGDWSGILGFDGTALRAGWIGPGWINHPGHADANGWDRRPADLFIAAEIEP